MSFGVGGFLSKSILYSNPAHPPPTIFTRNAPFATQSRCINWATFRPADSVSLISFSEPMRGTACAGASVLIAATLPQFTTQVKPASGAQLLTSLVSPVRLLTSVFSFDLFLQCT